MKTRPTVVVMSRQGRGSLPDAVWDALDDIAEVRVSQRDGRPDRVEAAALLADADFVGSTNLCLPIVDADLLDLLPRLRGIVLYATGFDHLDVPLLRARGISLSILSDYATGAVAEHGLAMLLALTTRLPLAHDRSRGVAPPGTSLRGVELAGRTVGIVGAGRIGRRLGGLCAGIGTAVVACDIDPVAAAHAEAYGARTGDLGWMLGRSDAVVLCASHVHGAPPIMGEAEIATMRPGSLLVNVARSALVDTAAAVAAVRVGHLRGYAVDDAVIDTTADGDLLAEGRILQTGHSAWWRDEVLVRGATMWGDRLIATAQGTPIDEVTGVGLGLDEAAAAAARSR